MKTIKTEEDISEIQSRKMIENIKTKIEKSTK